MNHLNDDDLAMAAMGEEDTSDDQLAHLASCAICQDEVAAFQRAWEIAAQTVEEDRSPPAPPERIWDNIQAELGHNTQPESEGHDADPGQARRTWSRRVLAVAASFAVVAVVVVGGVGWWWSTADEVIMADTTLEPLAEVDPAAATLLEENGQLVLQVDAADLPAAEGYYELWLIDEAVEGMMSLGPLREDARIALPAGLDPSEFPVVDVSVEPFDGDPEHSGDSVLRGTLSLD